MSRRRTSTATTLPLPRNQWRECGIVEVTTSEGQRIPSHRRGDGYALDVVEGRVSFDVARREHMAAVRLGTRWGSNVPTAADYLLARSTTGQRR